MGLLDKISGRVAKPISSRTPLGVILGFLAEQKVIGPELKAEIIAKSETGSLDHETIVRFRRAYENNVSSLEWDLKDAREQIAAYEKKLAEEKANYAKQKKKSDSLGSEVYVMRREKEDLLEQLGSLRNKVEKGEAGVNSVPVGVYRKKCKELRDSEMSIADLEKELKKSIRPSQLQKVKQEAESYRSQLTEKKGGLEQYKKNLADKEDEITALNDRVKTLQSTIAIILERDRKLAEIEVVNLEREQLLRSLDERTAKIFDALSKFAPAQDAPEKTNISDYALKIIAESYKDEQGYSVLTELSKKVKLQLGAKLGQKSTQYSPFTKKPFKLAKNFADKVSEALSFSVNPGPEIFYHFAQVAFQNRDFDKVSEFASKAIDGEYSFEASALSAESRAQSDTRSAHNLYTTLLDKIPATDQQARDFVKSRIKFYES